MRQVTAAKPEVSPAAVLNSPVAENADCKPFPISESHGIQFQRLRYPSSSRCKYKCLECGTIVTNHRPHAIAHNDIRPYVCVCGKSYKQSGHLMGHKKTCSQALSHKKKTKDLKKTLELFFSETEEEFEEIPESEEEHD